jgi:oligopeptide/dipeptide ABC transporter ATP-binding protein
MMETADVHALFRAPAHPYTQGLIASVPDLKHAREPLSSIRGAPPDPRELPPGCRFAPRCPHVLAACDDGQPPSIRLSSGHSAACLRAREVLVPQ